MKKATIKKKENQVVEIHIYVHQVPVVNIGNSGTSIYTSPACPACGKVGQHVCAGFRYAGETGTGTC